MRVNLSGVCSDRAIRDDENAVGVLGSLSKIGKENDARAAGTQGSESFEELVKEVALVNIGGKVADNHQVCAVHDCA